MSSDDMPARVRQILEDQRITKAQLAKAARVSKGAVTQWSTGDVGTMSFEAATNLSREFGYAVRWLIEGAQPRMAKDTGRYMLTDPAEHELIDLWRELVPPQRAEVLKQVRELREHNRAIYDQMSQQRQPGQRRGEKLKL